MSSRLSHLQPCSSHPFPFRNEIGVCVLVLEQVVVQLSRNRFSFVKQFVNVSAPLVMDTEHGPGALDNALALMRLILHCNKGKKEDTL